MDTDRELFDHIKIHFLVRQFSLYQIFCLTEIFLSTAIYYTRNN